MPQSGATWAKKFSKASSPPAEAPMPTMGKSGAVAALAAPAFGTARAESLFAIFACLMAFLFATKITFSLLRCGYEGACRLSDSHIDASRRVLFWAANCRPRFYHQHDSIIFRPITSSSKLVFQHVTGQFGI